MASRVAIIGSGPTGIYSLKGLVSGSMPLDISIFESEAEPGRGTPYHPDINDRAMLSDIASIELPEIRETLVGWLRRQAPEELSRLGIERAAIDEREFYPRIVLTPRSLTPPDPAHTGACPQNPAATAPA